MSDNKINWDESTVDDKETLNTFARFDDEDFPEDNPIEQDIINESDQSMFESGSHKKDIKLGYTSVAIILISLLVVVLIVLGVLDRVSIVKKTPQPAQQVQQGVVEDTVSEETVENNKGNAEQSKDTQASTQTLPQSNSGLTELPADTVMDYAGDVVKAKGVIHDKVKYISGDMVVYCIKINASIGGKSKVLDYYCGYNVFNSVSTGDEVTVDYQFVSRNCFSVNTISK